MKKLIIIAICIFTAVFAEARGCGPCGPCGPGGWGRGPCGPGGWGPPPPGPGWGHGGWHWGRGGCNFWPGFAGSVIGGMIGSAYWNRPYYGYSYGYGYAAPVTTVVQPTVVTQPVVVQPTVVTQPIVTQQVVTRTPIWIPGQYVTSANGVSVWQPGHYQ